MSCSLVAQAALYVKSCRDLWRNTPGALEFIRKIRNTQVCCCPGLALLVAAPLNGPSLAPLRLLQTTAVVPITTTKHTSTTTAHHRQQVDSLPKFAVCCQLKASLPSNL